MIDLEMPNPAVAQTGLVPQIIRHCIQVGLVSRSLTEEVLAELRRVRRLTQLEVNLAGAEIIVRMNRQIVALRAELAELKRPDINYEGERYDRT